MTTRRIVTDAEAAAQRRGAEANQNARPSHDEWLVLLDTREALAELLDQVTSNDIQAGWSEAHALLAQLRGEA